MEDRTFLTVFQNYRPDEPLLRLLRRCSVCSADMDEQKRTLDLVLELPGEAEQQTLDAVARGLMHAYDLTSVAVHHRRVQKEFTVDAVRELTEELCRRNSVINGFFDGMQCRLEDSRLRINLRRGFPALFEKLGIGRDLEKLISDIYGLSITVEITMDDGQDPLESLQQQRTELEKEAASAAKQAPAAKRTEPAKPREFRREKRPKVPVVAEENLLYGKPFGEPRTPLGELTSESGVVAVEGDLFFTENKTSKDGRTRIVTADITDGTGSIRLKVIGSIDKVGPLGERLKTGMHVAVRGEITYDSYDKDNCIKAFDIIRETKQIRMDTAEEKRVELHLHTKMSAMDGVAEVSELIERAALWGHPAVAITDHGVAQAFPDALKTLKLPKVKESGIKVIYGCEGYYVNNLEDISVVSGGADGLLTDEFICFDFETTGTDPREDSITEIGASLIRDGRVIDNFQTFAHPLKPIPENVVKLTGITNAMVADAPSQREAVERFLEFAGGRILVAHNAIFDMSFLARACENIGIEAPHTSIDTLEMSRILLPENDRHKLSNVAQTLKLPKFNSHRATDDSRTLAGILIHFFGMLSQRGVSRVSQINGKLSDIRRENAERRLDAKSLPTYHILLLAKNREGIRNLNRLISEGHIHYMNSRKLPIIPRNLLSKYREGLLIGSACEAGELFQAVLAGQPWRELCAIAKFYDFLEIQPIGNNAFMLRNGTVKSEEQLQNFNRTVLKLGEDIGIPVVATGDVHFLEPKDEIYRRILMHAKGFEDADNQAPLYFKTTQEMLSEFAYLGAKKAYEVVVTNTRMIAEQCEVFSPYPKETFPPVLPGAEEEFKNLVTTRAIGMYGDPLPEIIRSQLDREMGVIIKHGYAVMYMIAQKLIRRSNDFGYMVGSRGSVGSSIAAFFSGVSEVNALPPHYYCPSCRYSEFHKGGPWGCGPDMPDKDCPNCGEPLKKDGFDIPFECFLGFDGDKIPDIDLNFSSEYQSQAHQHIIDMFGKENVFRAGTIGTVKEKTAYGYVKKYNEERGITVTRVEENRLAIGCSGVKRTTGQHPGGLIVVPESKEIFDICAIQYPADDESNMITTHIEYHAIEDNLLKFDMLGHTGPTMLRYLQEETGIRPDDIPVGDEKVISIFSSYEALGIRPDDILGPIGATAIPEFGTKNTRKMLEETLPKTIDGLVRISGLSHGTDVWAGNIQELIRDRVVTLQEAICCRDDIMLYLIRMGLEPRLAFTIMESVRKGRKLKPEWEDVMREHEVPEWYIGCCNKIQYMFPKAHAVAYVVTGFRIAWFKVNQPLAFYASYFTISAGSFDAAYVRDDETVVAKYLEIMDNREATQNELDFAVALEVCHEMYMRGFSFLPVDIYKSHPVRFTVEDGAVRLPLSSVKGVSEAAAEDIAAERETGAFISAEDLSVRCAKVTSAAVTALYEVGAMGSVPATTQYTLF